MSSLRIIGGTFRNRKLLSPKTSNVRPTLGALRKTLFDICRDIVSDAVVLDLFAGSGILSFEALSRGAHSATCVDNHKGSLRCIEQNAATLGVEGNIEVYLGDAFRMIRTLARQRKQYDLVFADPPYNMPCGEKLLALVDDTPLLNEGGMLFIESSQPSYDEGPLSTLSLVSTRKVGRSFLHQYRREVR